VAWHVLIPIKPPPEAKSRLRTPGSPHQRHARLVLAIQRDTIDAVVVAQESSSLIAAVYLVTSSPELDAPWPDSISLLPDPGGGLNVALATSAASIAERHPADGVVALVADLPALRPHDLLDALKQAAASGGRTFVADREGTGTTMLAAAAGCPLAPAFGSDSASRHRASGADELDAAISLRSDVDTPTDVRWCLQLGVGSRTAAVAAEVFEGI
jgi:2-phospho-L-lactate guanylyltransferase